MSVFAPPHKPYDPAIVTDFEIGLVGAALYDQRVIERLPALSATHFHTRELGALWAEICARHAKGQTVDIVTIKPWWLAQPYASALGGAQFLLSCLERAARLTTHAIEYAQHIRDAAAVRELLRLASQLQAMAGEGQPSAELLARLDLGLRAVETGDETDWHMIGNVAKEFVSEIDKPSNEIISTGIAALDARLGGGLRRNDLIILAGRPSMGKTTLANVIAGNAAQRGLKVAFFSQEMDRHLLMYRTLARLSRSEYSRLSAFAYFDLLKVEQGKRAPGIERSQIARYANDILAKWPLAISDAAAVKVGDVDAGARAIKRKLGGLDLIVIDYLQIMGRNRERGQTDASSIGDITTALKALAKRLHVPVVLLSQLNRSLESRDDKRPLLSDLRDSGAIEQDADTVMFVYRESYYLERSRPDESDESATAEWKAKMKQVQGTLDVIVAKQRMGPIGTETLHAELPMDFIADRKGGAL